MEGCAEVGRYVESALDVRGGQRRCNVDEEFRDLPYSVHLGWLLEAMLFARVHPYKRWVMSLFLDFRADAGRKLPDHAVS